MKEDIDNIALMLKAGWAAFYKGEYQQAIDLYQKLIATGQRSPDVYWAMAVCHRMLEKNEDAIAVANEALSMNPHHFLSLELLATIYNDQGNDDLTYKYINKALTCIPRTVAETSPRLVKTAKKVSKVLFGARTEKEVEEIFDLEEEDRLWIVWAREFKTAYEAKHPEQTQKGNNSNT